MSVFQPAISDAPAISNSGITPQTTGAGTALNTDFETFLKMLTAQMKNQDPLNPMDGTEFAAQLATFSGVEQQVRTNELLAALGAQFSAMGLAQMAGWVGMEARAAAPALFDGAPIEISPNPAAGASRAELVVRDDGGNVVQRAAIALSGQSFDWAGVAGDGTPLANGIYSFTVESFRGAQLLSATPAEHYAAVTEVRGVDGQTVVILKGGAQIKTAEISALRQPGG